MNKFVAILRGINVGGSRKILMKDLKALFEEMGLAQVKTYIQSGNVIFASEGSVGSAELAKRIEESIQEKFGFEVPVVLRTSEELHRAVVQNPFYREQQSEVGRLHLTFLKEIPQQEDLFKILASDFSPDGFDVKEEYAYIYCAGKYHESKLTNKFFESKLKVPATTRNWKTVLKLNDLLQKH